MKPESGLHVCSLISSTMRKLLLALAILPTLTFGQTKLAVVVGGKRVGTATLLQKILVDGTKLVQLSMDLKSDSMAATVRSEATYTAKGAPIRKFQETLVPAQKVRRTVVITFDKEGASVVADLNGKRTTKKVTLPETTQRDDASEFWFLRDQPKKGAEAKAYTFDIETLSWSLLTTTYEGEIEITIGGKKVKAHRTKSDKGVAYLDANGNPLKLETGNGALERIW